MSGWKTFLIGAVVGAATLFIFNVASKHFEKKIEKEVLLTSHTYWGNGHPFIMLWTTSAALGRDVDHPGADVDVPVDEVSVKLRGDGKKITTVQLIDPEDPEYYRCGSAVILVPDDWQLDYWQGTLYRIRTEYHEYFKKAPR